MDDGDYVDECYNDKLSLAAATPVTLTAPNDLTNINFALNKGGLNRRPCHSGGYRRAIHKRLYCRLRQRQQ